MPYYKTVWTNNTGAALDEDNLNKIEDGIEQSVVHAESTHAPLNADNTALNETSHEDVLVDADIGVNVEAHNSNIQTHIGTIAGNPHNVSSTDVGLGNVDNTSDLNKPLSNDTQDALNLKENVSNKSQPNGYASLDNNAKIPTIQLPSYVDDVLESDDFISLPIPGEVSKIYVTLDDNNTYRWSGSVYVEITSGAVDSVNGYTGAISLTKTDIGLGNVDNTSDLNKPLSTDTQDALNLKIDTADIGVSVQAYDTNIVSDANYVHTDNNYTDDYLNITEQNQQNIINNAAAIANLATAQSQFSSDDITTITATNQILSFIVDIPSTDSNIFSLDDTTDTITFYKNASYNFTSRVSFSSSTNLERDVIFDLVNIDDETIIASEVINMNTQNGKSEVIPIVSLLTIGRDTFPAAPVTIQIRVRANGTGYSITDFHSVLASSSTYDITSDASGITYIPSGDLISTNVQDVIEELDSEKAPLESPSFTGTPTYEYGWKDNIQSFSSASGTGVSDPVHEDIGNGLYLCNFSVQDELFVEFHVDHDYAIGTNAYPFINFLCQDTQSSGNTVTWRFKYVIAKGHSQGQSLTVPATNVDITYTYTGAEIAGEHIIAECSDIQAFDLIEPDTIILTDVELLSETVTGKIYGISAGLHYQADRETTLNKVPNFYV